MININQIREMMSTVVKADRTFIEERILEYQFRITEARAKAIEEYLKTHGTDPEKQTLVFYQDTDTYVLLPNEVVGIPWEKAIREYPSLSFKVEFINNSAYNRPFQWIR